LQKLLRFSQTEIEGGRDILRAAVLTSDLLCGAFIWNTQSIEFRHTLMVCQPEKDNLFAFAATTGYLKLAQLG
jgi:hypothetical protein